jgi:hypothetical protein
VAAAPRVQNLLPAGSTWDGKSDLPMDEATFKQMLSDSEPAAGGDAPPQGAPAPATGPAAKRPEPPRNGG